MAVVGISRTPFASRARLTAGLRFAREALDVKKIAIVSARPIEKAPKASPAVARITETKKKVPIASARATCSIFIFFTNKKIIRCVYFVSAGHQTFVHGNFRLELKTTILAYSLHQNYNLRLFFYIF
jgi:hypothetical protein